MREISLQEENVAYGKAISNCENKIQEKRQEADLLLRKLEVMVKDPNFEFCFSCYFQGFVR